MSALQRLVAAFRRWFARIAKAVRVWLWKRTLMVKAEYREFDGHTTAVAYVSISPELLDSLEGDEVQGEAIAQKSAELAASSMGNLHRKRMKIGRYAPK